MTYSIIKTKQQYENYCDLLHELVRDNSTRNTDDVELLTLLVEKWEKDNLESWPKFDPIQLIKELMDLNNLKAKDLGDILNLSKGTISKMLNYQKSLSKDTIRKLALRFKIDQAALNKPYPLVRHVPSNHKVLSAVKS